MCQQRDEKVAKQVLESKIFYTIGIINASFHIIVGSVWEIVSLPRGTSPLLQLPYFGGYLILIGAALICAFIYFLLSLKIEPRTPINLRRFYLIIIIIVTVASFTLFIMMSIRVGDFAAEKDKTVKQDYFGVVTITIIDIVLTFLLMPSNIYLFVRKYQKIRKQAERIAKEQNRQGPMVEEGEIQGQTGRHLRIQTHGNTKGVQINIMREDIDGQMIYVPQDNQLKAMHQLRNIINNNPQEIYILSSTFNPAITLEQNILQSMKSQEALNAKILTQRTTGFSQSSNDNDTSKHSKSVRVVKTQQGRPIIVNITFASSDRRANDPPVTM